jgi:protein O-GlcNAc transferase
MLIAYSALGKIHQRHGRLEDALAAYREVLRRDPNNASAHVDIGNVYQSQGEGAKAFESYQEAIRIDPEYAFAFSNVGATLNEEGLRDQAIAYCRRAIEIDPKFAIAHGNLAVALQAVGRYDESLAHHRLAIECDPNDAGLHGNLLYLLNYDSANDPVSTFAEHRAWGRRHADPLTARSRGHDNDRSENRRLRLGYVSGHFKAHAVNFFVEPVLASHDHDRFEVFCYSNVPVEDEVTARLRGHADGWRRIRGFTDEQAAEQVRADQIDILVDLSGHIGGNRLQFFAHKPAPVQVTYIGYQNTTGMRAIDYRLTDAYADPPGETDALYTEKLIRLPRSFFCYLPSADAPPVVPPPAAANGYVTFGSFNNITKVRPEVLQTWSVILRGVSGSRLMILGDMADSLKHYLTETFAGLGIGAERLELAHRRPREGYLELIQRADVALDPFPFNGHTTTCDALWQGVPVVARRGSQYVSRFGCSGLATLGLEEFVATSAEQYAEIATRLALDPDRLAMLRATLRQRMADSALLDFAGFTRNLESAYRTMWHDWCAV